MLRIYPVCLQMVRDVRPYAERIEKRDRTHAQQLRDASSSTVLNVAEGMVQRGGRRRNAYTIALGEAQETLTNLEVAEGHGYIDGIEDHVRNRLHHIIGTLVKLVR